MARDSLDPSIPSDLATVANVIIPTDWILQNISRAAEMFPPNPNSYRAFGGQNSQATNDQANSLSQAHRKGGYMYYFSFFDYPGLDFPLYDDSFFTDLFPKMFDTSDG